MRFARSVAYGCLVAVCGPPKYSELRINLAQAFNGIGTVVAPVLGSYVFFVDVGEGSEALRNVQWVYLAIAIFVYILAVVFYFATVSWTNPSMLYVQLILSLDP
jgi:FHS family L-fucose permease-like MFS transporter